MAETRTDTHHSRRPAQTEEGLALLVIHHPDREMLGARRLVGQKATHLLGRADESCLPGVFDDSKVSRRHAEVRRQGQRVLVEDLGSRNGTFVNGEQVSSATLRDGDIVGVGRILLMLQRGPRTYRRPGAMGMVGVGAALADIESQIRTVARTETVVTVVGETGTGKELVARALHEQSRRRGDLVALNCAGVADSLLASELFGHTRGAFTGAMDKRSGLIAVARGGTLFLDEITDASAGLQASLLRLLETGRYRPVGGDRELDSGVRFVAACQPRVHEAVAAEEFRPDLWARLSRWVIDVPALRARREDIPSLARHFAGRPLSAELAMALLDYPWPHNIRELQAVIERTVLSHPDDDELELDAWLEERLEVGSRAGAVPAQDPVETADGWKVTRQRVRPPQSELVAAFREHGGSVRATAKSLGVSRKTVYRWMEAYGLDPESLR